MYRNATLTILVAALCLSSCSFVTGRGLPASSERCLAGPEAFDGDLWGSFAVDIVSPSGEAELSIQAEMNAEGSALVGFTPFGNRGMSVLHRKHELHVDSNPSWRSPLEPVELLHIFEIALWPVEGLRGALASCGMEISERLDPWSQREIRKAGELVYRIDSFSAAGGVPVRIVTMPLAGSVVRIHGPR